uniref:Uncharacterized protein n=1 Tax=Clostridioides difficile TaxID=1496 RepID=A0A381I9P9_CLODI|nr:Uncharacterised protein [Clostridioides difficile]
MNGIYYFVNIVKIMNCGLEISCFNYYRLTL